MKKGFTAVEAVVVVVLLAILGFVFWNVVSDDETEDVTTNTAQKDEENISESSENNYASEELGVSFTLPDSWVVEKLGTENPHLSLDSGTRFAIEGAEEDVGIHVNLRTVSDTSRLTDTFSAEEVVSIALGGNGLLAGKYLTLHSTGDAETTGKYDSFTVTETEVTSSEYSPAIEVDEEIFEIWGSLTGDTESLGPAYEFSETELTSQNEYTQLVEMLESILKI